MKHYRTALILMGLSILIATLSCKTRSYLKTDVSSQISQQSTSHTDSTSKATTTSVDTSTIRQGAITIKTDSSILVTNFVPDSGAKVTINPDGSISGSFKSITTIRHNHKSSTKRDTSTTHKAIIQTTADSSHKVSITSASSQAKRDSTYKSGKSNSTASANIPWYAWVLGILVLAALGYGVFRYFAAKV